MGLNEQAVRDARYLESAGMTKHQLRELHHFWPATRGITFRGVYKYFGDSAERDDNNTHFANRLKYVADGIRSGGTDMDALIVEAVQQWPLNRK